MLILQIQSRSDAKAKRTTPPQCVKGQSCGASCISKGLNCRIKAADLSRSGKAASDRIANTLSRGEQLRQKHGAIGNRGRSEIIRGGSATGADVDRAIAARKPKEEPKLKKEAEKPIEAPPIEQVKGLDIPLGKMSLLRSGEGMISDSEFSDVSARLGDRVGTLVGTVNPYEMSESTKKKMDNAIAKRLSKGELKEGDVFVGENYIGTIKDGKLDLQHRETQLLELRRSVFENAQSSDIWSAEDRAMLDAADKAKLNRRTIRAIQREEAQWQEIESLDRRETTDKRINGNIYRRKAEEWSTEQGFNDEGANGFSAAQTRAHDIAHPVAFDMLNMNSQQIKDYFGDDGLIAEEAVVNSLERMSRGEPPRLALANGVRLARVLSRGGDNAANYRNSEFTQKLGALVDRMYNNPDFYRYLRVVRNANRISGTVTRSAGV